MPIRGKRSGLSPAEHVGVAPMNDSAARRKQINNSMPDVESPGTPRCDRSASREGLEDFSRARARPGVIGMSAAVRWHGLESLAARINWAPPSHVDPLIKADAGERPGFAPSDDGFQAGETRPVSSRSAWRCDVTARCATSAQGQVLALPQTPRRPSGSTADCARAPGRGAVLCPTGFT